MASSSLMDVRRVAVPVHELRTVLERVGMEGLVGVDMVVFCFGAAVYYQMR